MIAELQDEVDTLQARVAELEDAPVPPNGVPVEAVAPAGDAELRALAVTVRTAQRSGHPDATKHLDALLKALGAV